MIDAFLFRASCRRPKASIKENKLNLSIENSVNNPAMLAGGEINGAIHVYAGYLVARNLALALLLIITLSMGAGRPLSTLMVLTAIIQMLDAVMNGFEGRWSLIPGVLVFAVAFLFGATRATGYPFWTLAAWRDAG